MARPFRSLLRRACAAVPPHRPGAGGGRRQRRAARGSRRHRRHRMRPFLSRLPVRTVGRQEREGGGGGRAGGDRRRGLIRQDTWRH